MLFNELCSKAKVYSLIIQRGCWKCTTWKCNAWKCSTNLQGGGKCRNGEWGQEKYGTLYVK